MQFDKDYVADGYSNLTKSFLEDHHLYLTCEFDLVTIYDDLVENLDGTKLVVANDCTVGQNVC